MRFAPCLVLAALFCIPAEARDTGQWSRDPPKVRAWFESLMQPDAPVSCCGSGDGYYADEVSVVNGQTIATVTDSRGNPIPVGTKVIVPANKMNKDPNLTGHTIIFLGGLPDAPTVYCFIAAAGV